MLRACLEPSFLLPSRLLDTPACPILGDLTWTWLWCFSLYREIGFTLGCSCEQRGGYLGSAEEWSQQGHAGQQGEPLGASTATALKPCCMWHHSRVRDKPFGASISPAVSFQEWDSGLKALTADQRRKPVVVAVTLSKLLNISDSQCPHCDWGSSSIHFIALVELHQTDSFDKHLAGSQGEGNVRVIVKKICQRTGP